MWRANVEIGQIEARVVDMEQFRQKREVGLILVGESLRSHQCVGRCHFWHDAAIGPVGELGGLVRIGEYAFGGFGGSVFERPERINGHGEVEVGAIDDLFVEILVARNVGAVSCECVAVDIVVGENVVADTCFETFDSGIVSGVVIS